jgi:hypothetical protein
MHAPYELAWKLNWYRQSELEGALLLGKLVQRAREPYLIHRLIEHCADEARHARLWDRTIVRLNLPTLRIRRSYQSFYREEVAPPSSLTEALALTHVFEHRVHRQFKDELQAPGLPLEARRTFTTLLHDEVAHLDWIARWLERVPRSDDLVGRYREADERVYERLRGHGDRIWTLVGSNGRIGSNAHARVEELHTA